jgi:transcriptional regulator with XRE-family HTH domain
MGGRAGTDVSSRLVGARRRAGWSREALAYHSGVSWSAIAQIESGRRGSPRPQTLVALARALKVTVEYLVGDGLLPIMVAHRAVLYGSDEEFVDAVAPFVSEGVERSEPVLVVTSARNRELLRRAIRPGRKVRFGDHVKWYGSPLSAIAAYRAFLKERIEAGASWIRIAGEPVWPSASKRDVDPWVTYESMFNLIFEVWPLTVICLYDTRSADAAIVRVARQTHPYLVEGTRLDRNEAYVEPEKFVLGR